MTKNQNQIDKIMSASEKVFKDILKNQIGLIEVVWADWVKYRDETLKAEVEENFPNGFKDYLVKVMRNEIKN